MKTGRVWTIWAVLVLAVCAAYANSLQNEFHFDDFHTTVDNPAIRSLHNAGRFFTDATTFSVLPANRTYRPFVSLSLAVDYAVGHGYKPFWFHLSTLLVFLLQLAVMLWLYERIADAATGGREPPPANHQAAALAAVAWYGLHPAMAETVNYIIQRGDIYSTLGVVGALAMYACLPKLRRTGLYLLPFVFGIFSKPPAIVLPVLLFAYVAYFDAEGKNRWKRAATAALPSIAVGALAIWLQSAMTPKSFAPSTISNFDYCITQPFVLLRYFGSFFLPIHLNVDTDLGAFDGFTTNAMWGFLFLAAVVLAIWLTARRKILRPISFGLLWFLVASITTSVYRLSEVENDHRMYMPFVGLVLAATWLLWLSVERIAALRPKMPVRPIALALGVVALIAYSYGVHERNRVWRNEETLWLDDVQKSPHNGRGLMNYGLTQLEKGAYAEALEYFERALLYTPNYPTLEINLGVVCGAMGNAEGAKQHFLRAIALAPTDDEPYFYYGRWLYGTGRVGDALPQLREAVQLNPARLPPRDLLLQALQASGDDDEARTLAQQTLAITPDDAVAQSGLANPVSVNADSWINISLSRYQQHDYVGTIAAANEALKLNPKSEIAYNNIGAAYASLNQWQQAIAAEKQALTLRPDFQLAKDNLEWALAEKQKGEAKK
jgi:tetratricopeptide (TPR) repeat protein